MLALEKEKEAEMISKLQRSAEENLEYQKRYIEAQGRIKNVDQKLSNNVSVPSSSNSFVNAFSASTSWAQDIDSLVTDSSGEYANFVENFDFKTERERFQEEMASMRVSIINIYMILSKYLLLLLFLTYV